MTKNEMKIFAGERIYAEVARMGGVGKFVEPTAIAVYEVTRTGGLIHVEEIYHYIGNKRQKEEVERLFPRRFRGRPTAEKISVEQMKELIK